MERKTHKLLQQAGQFVQIGKLKVALERYLEIHELEPQETTIINTIGDLYVRLGDKGEAIRWYQKLAEAFESSDLLNNTTATYRKILRLSPYNQHVMTRLAELYERQGQTANALLQYKMIADQLVRLDEYDQAITAYRKICSLEPSCYEAQLELARLLEKLGRLDEATQAYLTCASQCAQQGNREMTRSLVQSLFRLRPNLNALSLSENPDFQAVVIEAFMAEGDLDSAKKQLLEQVRKFPVIYPTALKVLHGLAAQKDLEGSLDVVEAIYELAIQFQDEMTLKGMLEMLLDLDESNTRLLKLLTVLLHRTDNRQDLEDYLKRLVILELRKGDLSEAKQNLNRIVILTDNSFYIESYRLLNEAMTLQSPQALEGICQKVIQSLEGEPYENDFVLASVASGVSNLDLGLGLE